MSTITRPFVASETSARATAFGLAALVTLTLLASMGGVADRQYEAALVAQADEGPARLAASPTLALAQPLAERRAQAYSHS
jgi:hypothetical protein